METTNISAYTNNIATSGIVMVLDEQDFIMDDSRLESNRINTLSIKSLVYCNETQA
jgi:hypothetical protein